MADANVQNLPVIDWQAAVTVCEDESFLIELLTDFVQESRTHLNSLEGFVADANAKEIRFHAHAVKGSAGTLQAKRLQAASLALELVGQRGLSGEIEGAELRAQAEPLFADVKREHAALIDYMVARGISV